jgi:hypothetical protein
MSRPSVKQTNDEIYHHVLNCDLMEIFNRYRNESVNPFYLDRADRNMFAAKHLKDTSVRKILNIGGGGKRHLEESLNDNEFSVYEIDIEGDCDLKVNLDTLSALPFEDCSFDAVCSFDVLEHLENFHLINEEMFRVAKDYILIALPNSSCEIFFDPFFNRPQRAKDLDRGVYSKFYGLPLTRPSDRHRWWIYFFDAIRYYYYFSLKFNVKIEFWTLKLNLKHRIFKSIFGAYWYYMFFSPYIWVKIYK